jgi:hypothetical protein
VWSDDPADRDPIDLLDMPEENITDVAPESLPETVQNSENQTLLENILGQFAVDIQRFFSNATEIVTQAVLRAGEIITPKATVRELCIE